MAQTPGRNTPPFLCTLDHALCSHVLRKPLHFLSAIVLFIGHLNLILWIQIHLVEVIAT